MHFIKDCQSESNAWCCHGNTAQKVIENPEAFGSLSAADMTGVVTSSLRYLAKQDEKSTRAITVWIVADLGTKEGRAVLYNAIKHLVGSR